MSSSSSKSAPPPPTINPQLQHETTLNIPPDPGNSSHNPVTNSTVLSNNDPFPNTQNGNQTQTVTNEYQSNYNIAPPTPPQIWMAQNVYPLVTPMRIICLLPSQTSISLAYWFYTQTEHYKTHFDCGGHHYACSILEAAFIGSFVFPILLMFSSFFTKAYERYLHRCLLKSLGELMVMVFMSFLTGHNHEEEPYEVVACAFLPIYFLCLAILLKPGHHYSPLDATASLAVHEGLGLGGIYGILAVVFILVILFIKNYLWSHNTGHAQAPTSEGH